MPYRSTGARYNDTCSKTLTLPMETWAQLYEIAKIKSKTSRQALVQAIKSEWEFQKDREKHQALRQLELDRIEDNNPNKVIKDELSNIPQVEN